jgi:hypothetical protein
MVGCRRTGNHPAHLNEEWEWSGLKSLASGAGVSVICVPFEFTPKFWMSAPAAISFAPEKGCRECDSPEGQPGAESFAAAELMTSCYFLRRSR